MSLSQECNGKNGIIMELLMPESHALEIINGGNQLLEIMIIMELGLIMENGTSK